MVLFSNGSKKRLGIVNFESPTEIGTTNSAGEFREVSQPAAKVVHTSTKSIVSFRQACVNHWQCFATMNFIVVEWKLSK